MLHNTYYIIKPGILQQPLHAGADAFIALEMESGDKENYIHTFQQAEKYLQESRFCLFIHITTVLTSEQATNFISFLFFSNYYRPGATPQIIVGGENNSLILSGIEQLYQAAKEQGFPSIHITPAATLPGIIASTGQEFITETYRSWLQAPAITTNILCINVAQATHINAIREALEAEEALFSRQNPDLYTLKMQNRELNKHVQQLELLYTASQQEISNQVSHNQILRSSSQATALQNYYNNEYEVLPLWFKRLGHLVKALMGKRSFKSLYSNKVKKYKD